VVFITTGVNFLAGNREAAALHQNQLLQNEKMKIAEVQLSIALR
jgi:hypothetical protein